MKRMIAAVILGTLTACQKPAPPPPPSAPVVEAPTSQVAKVNVSALKAQLQQLVFAKPENQELKTKFEALQATQQARAMEMMKKFTAAKKKGKMEVPFGAQPRDPNVDAYHLMEETVNNLIKKELADVIQRAFPDKYTVVIEQSYSDNIIYSKLPVPDITNDVRDFLVRDSLPKTPPSPTKP